MSGSFTHQLSLALNTGQVVLVPGQTTQLYLLVASWMAVITELIVSSCRFATTMSITPSKASNAEISAPNLATNQRTMAGSCSTKLESLAIICCAALHMLKRTELLKWEATLKPFIRPWLKLGTKLWPSLVTKSVKPSWLEWDMLLVGDSSAQYPANRLNVKFSITSPTCTSLAPSSLNSTWCVSLVFRFIAIAELWTKKSRWASSRLSTWCTTLLVASKPCSRAWRTTALSLLESIAVAPVTQLGPICLKCTMTIVQCLYMKVTTQWWLSKLLALFRRNWRRFLKVHQQMDFSPI